MGGETEFERLVDLARQHVDRDDRRRPAHPGAHHRRQTHAAGPDDDHARSGGYLGADHGGAEAGADATGQSAHELERGVGADRDDETVGDDGELCVGTLVVQGVDRSPGLGQPGGAVEHGTGEERGVFAQGLIVPPALEAPPAGADDRADHVIPDLDAGGVGAGLDHHAGRFVAQHDRIRDGDLAGGEVQVGVAHPHGVHLDFHLTGLRRGVVDVLDTHVARAKTDHRSHRRAIGVRRICPGRSRMVPTSDSPLRVMAVPFTNT